MQQSNSTQLVFCLGTAQTIAFASSYYLPAILAEPMAHTIGISTTTVFIAFSLSLIVSALPGPLAGKLIDRFGGRPILMVSSLMFALGLFVLGFAYNMVTLFAGWVFIGLAMGTGLYEAAFSTLVRLLGQDARPSISGITLLAGFASTLGWPLSTWMQTQWGWQGACWGWAALHLLVSLPLYALLPNPRKTMVQEPAHAILVSLNEGGLPPEVPDGFLEAAQVPDHQATKRTAIVLSITFTVIWFSVTAMAVHLPRLLESTGLSLQAAVGIAALVGPAQVLARFLEFGFLRRIHPLVQAKISSLAHPLGGLALLMLGGPAAALFAVLHGAGAGILTIIKGTLPLVLFGSQGYGARQGLIMLPARIGQAFAPFVFSILMSRFGTQALWFTVLPSFAVVLMLGLLGCRRSDKLSLKN